MRPIVSIAWDRFAVVTAALFTACSALCVPGFFLVGWRGLFYEVDLPGRWNAWSTIPGIAILAFLPWALTYWHISRWPVELSDDGIAGISQRGIIAFSAIEKWAISGRTLLLWPMAGQATPEQSHRRTGWFPYIRRGSVARFWVRPGVPTGTYWAAIEDDKVHAISALLTEQFGPPSEVPQPASRNSDGRRISFRITRARP